MLMLLGGTMKKASPSHFQVVDDAGDAACREGHADGCVVLGHRANQAADAGQRAQALLGTGELVAPVDFVEGLISCDFSLCPPAGAGASRRASKGNLYTEREILLICRKIAPAFLVADSQPNQP
jgi:hypothetical protein